jgi:hypothetical protein
MFNINDGSSDRLIAITPWTLNEFVIFMRNSVFYCSVGVGAELDGQAAQESNSYVKSLASDIGCIARGTAIQAAGGILFLSDNGIFMLNPSGTAQGGVNTPEGMRLLALAEPISAPINDVIARVNYNYVDKATAIYWENRYYIAVPLDSSTKNNAVLVYNFVNKAWESVDVYPEGFDIKQFIVAKRGSKRRLFAIDGEEGVFLLEENNWDEYGSATGLPRLPGVGESDTFVLDTTSAILETTSFQANQIQGQLITRAYSFDTNRQKRFSGIQTDIFAPGGGVDTMKQKIKDARSEIEKAFVGTRAAGADKLALKSPDEIALQFHVALVSLPAIGRNILDDEGWRLPSSAAKNSITSCAGLPCLVA